MASITMLVHTSKEKIIRVYLRSYVSHSKGRIIGPHCKNCRCITKFPTSSLSILLPLKADCISSIPSLRGEP